MRKRTRARRKSGRSSKRKWRWTTRLVPSRLSGLGSRRWARTWSRSAKAREKERRARRSELLRLLTINTINYFKLTMVELEEQKLGSPWSVLPIKNNKYAKDLIEVHLSDRALTGLEKFDNFPNLEVIWLNNNNVSSQPL